MTGVSASTVVAEADPSDFSGGLETDIVELDQSTAVNVMGEAMQDPQVRTIHTRLADEGFRPDRQAVNAHQASYRGQTWEILHIPYATASIQPSSQFPGAPDEVDAGLVWSSRTESEVTGFVSTVERAPDAPISPDVKEAMEQTGIDPARVGSTSVRLSLDTIGIENGTSTVETNSRVVPQARELPGQDLAPTDTVSTRGSCLCTALDIGLCTPCGYPDWGCIRRLAGAYAAEIGACSVCAYDPSKPTCAPCLGAIVEQLASGETPFCCYCNAWWNW